MKSITEASFTIVVLAILVTCVILPGLVCAVDYAVGVKAGDWIKYGQLSVTWTGNGTEPSYVADEKKTDWVKMEVENVTGTIVNLNVTVHYNNGTKTYQISSVDLNGSVYMGSRFLIPANLKSGDLLSTQPNSPRINQTITRTYASASRNVNLLNVTASYLNQTATFTVYFDQSTGFMVEMCLKQPDYSNPSAYIETSAKATETNMWSPDLLGTLTNNIIYIIAGTLTIVAVIAAAIALRKRKTSVPPKPPPEQTAQTVTANY
jgi:hypothetical protein